MVQTSSGSFLAFVCYVYSFDCQLCSHDCVTTVFIIIIMCRYMYIHVLMRDAEGRKKQASKVVQTTIKAKQQNTPKAVTFPK